jgi:hypothetical protein
MKYTYTKTIKSILDFFNNRIFYTYTKLDGTIYKDEANNAYFQIVDMDLSKVEKNTNRNSAFMTINEEFKYRPDKIAYVAYGNETLAWIILRFNNITDPFDLEIGKIIEIPPLQNINAAIKEKRKRLQYL